MAATTNVQVVISGKDNASSVIKGVGRSFNNLGNQVSSSLKTIGTFGLIGVAGLAAFATKAAFSSARVEELGFALNAIAKANKISQKEVDKTVDALRGFNIAHDKALEITSLFIQSELDLADATKLATVAKDLAVLASLDSSQATKDLTRAIVTQRPILLKQFGIQKGLVEIYDDYADSVGKVAEDLTQAEKKQAFLNTILTEGNKVAGVYEASMGSVSKRFRSLTGRIIPDFMAKIGKAFQPALTAIVDALANSIADLSDWIDANQETIKRWAKVSEDVSKQIIKSIGAIVDFLRDNKEILVGVLVAFALGIGAVVTAFLIAKAVLIGVFAAIVFQVVFFMKMWQQSMSSFKRITKAASEFLSNTLEPAFEKVFSAISDIVEKVIDSITETWDGFVDKFETIVNDISKVVDKLATVFSDFAKDFKKDAEGTLTDAAEDLVLLMLNRIDTIFQGWVTGFDDMVDAAFDWGTQTWDTIDLWLTDIVVLFDDWLIDTLDSFLTWKNETVKSIEEGLDKWLLSIDEGLDNMFLSLNTFFTELPDKMNEWLDQTWENIKTWWGGLGESTLDETLKGFEKEQGNWILKIGGFILVVLGLVLALLAAELIDLGIRMVRFIIQGSISLQKGFKDKIHGLITGAFTLAGKVGTGIFDFGKKIVTKLVDGIKAAPKAVINAILDLIPNATLRAAVKKAVPGITKQTGGIVPGPIGAPQPILAHGGEEVKPLGPSGGLAGGGLTLNVNIGTFIGSEHDKRNLAEELMKQMENIAAMQGKNLNIIG